MKQIDAKTTLAIQQAAEELGCYGDYIDNAEFTRHLINRAENILNRPKYSPLCEKVWKVLSGDIDFAKKELNNVLEGVVELPSSATHEMAVDLYNAKMGTRSAINQLFDNIRMGKYEDKE